MTRLALCLVLAALSAGPARAQGSLVTNPFASNLPSVPIRPAPAPEAALFPRAIAPAYADRSPGTARRLTCLDRYRANKAAGEGNGGLPWTRRGGGYYAECNRRLGG
ncbi:hypothetical protein [Methylobacterium sp. JK268]